MYDCASILDGIAKISIVVMVHPMIFALVSHILL